jgi:glycosyltransferase involved in cell wall biosynthesis
MKLLHVIGSMNPDTGGPCQTIRNFAPHFLASGHSLDVVCLDDPGSGYLKGEKFQVFALGAGRGSWNFHPALRPWLLANLKQYDVAILNGLWQYQGYALWKAAAQVKTTPYYIFPHGMLDPWFQKISVRPVKALRNWIVWKLFQNRIVQDAAGLLFTCEEERRLARLPFRPYAPKREDVVGLGVPEPPQYEARMKSAFLEKCPGASGKPYFLFLSRIHPKKGVDLLIQAYAELCRTAGGSTVPSLVIAGPGLDTTYGKEMQALAARLCPPNSVFWPGMLSGDAKWGALYHCEASVLPSHQENFGITVVETLACGRPVLISNQVNIWREIKESGAALVEPDSPDGATRLFRDWIKLSADARLKMASQARLCFQSYFSIESANRKLIAATAGQKIFIR